MREISKVKRCVETGDVVVLTAGIPALDVNAAREGISNMMRIATIE